MHNEISTAIEFITRLLKSSGVTSTQMDAFKAALESLLTHKFASHWSPSEPMKGNAYRSILVTQGFIDPVLVDSAKAAGLATLDKRWLPSELVIWIDPLEVTYRIGDHGSVATLPLEPLSLPVALPSTIDSLAKSNKESTCLSSSPSPSPSPASEAVVRNKFLSETASSSVATTNKDTPMPIEVR